MKYHKKEDVSRIKQVFENVNKYQDMKYFEKLTSIIKKLVLQQYKVSKKLDEVN